MTETLHVLFKIASIIMILLLVIMLIITGFRLNGDWLYFTIGILTYLFLSSWVLFSTWDLRKLRTELSEREKELHPHEKYKISFGFIDVFLAIFSFFIAFALLVILVFKLNGDDFSITRSIGLFPALSYFILATLQCIYCLSFQLFPKKVAAYIESLN